MSLHAVPYPNAVIYWRTILETIRRGSGTFTIVAVTVNGGLHVALVTSSPSTKSIIHGGGGNDVVGDLNWVEICGLGTSRNLNLLSEMNLTGTTYGGTQTDLMPKHPCERNPSAGPSGIFTLANPLFASATIQL